MKPKPRLVYKRGMWRCMREWFSADVRQWYRDVPGWGLTPESAYRAWALRNPLLRK